MNTSKLLFALLGFGAFTALGCGDGESVNATGSTTTGGDSRETTGAGGSVTTRCTDGVQNEGETDVDCGGPCAPCPLADSSVSHAHDPTKGGDSEMTDQASVISSAQAVFINQANGETGAEVESLFSARCFCKISWDDLSEQTTSTHVCLDLTGVVNTVYGGLLPQQGKNQGLCDALCTVAAGPHYQDPAVAACACAGGAPDGTLVRAWATVGVEEWESAVDYIGTVHRTAAQKQVKCPSGWLANTTNVDGGITADGKCKRLSVQPMSISPLPPNGTPMGADTTLHRCRAHFC
jgi:hypothetical protein